MENISVITAIISIVLSISAFGLSIYNLILQKRKIITESIVNNRSEWIKDVRNLMAEFLESYCEEKGIKRLRICKTKIELYTRRDSEEYKSLNMALLLCIEDKFNVEHYNVLIEECQKVLTHMWTRSKIESGISLRQDRKIYKLFAKIKG